MQTQREASGYDDAYEQAAFKRLLVMALGDRTLAERLIAHESRRTPGACRAALIESAIERWIRDIRYS